MKESIKKESENDRVRQVLCDIVRDMPHMETELHAHGLTVEQALAYLEKQKDSKWSPSEGEMGVLYKLCYISNQITDEDDTELTRLYQDLKREYFNGHSFENMFPSEKQKEQKPAEWSEEDETCLEYALWCVMKTRHFVAKDACDLDACRSAERWLNFIPKRFKLQPKQEWSKEDEEHINSIFNDFKQGVIPDEEDQEWLKNRLKSIRPQLSPKSDAEPVDPFDTIRLFTDINLVQELRRHGYEVTCKKTIEL